MRSIRQINTQRLADDWKFEFCTTVNGDGTPHIMMINSMFQLDSGEIAWGETCHGVSKVNIRAGRPIAFLTYENGGELTFGHAKLLRSEDGGALMDLFNSIPRYRYNTLWGFSPVHVMRLLDFDGPERLASYADARALTRKLAATVFPGVGYDAVSCWTRKFFDAPRSFKVIGWVDEKRMPQIAPLPQCELTPVSRAIFTLDQYAPRLAEIPEGACVAIYAVDFANCLTVMVEGAIARAERGGVRYGAVDIRAVYNSMMPKNGYIYPRAPLRPVTDWGTTAPGFNV